MGLNCESPGFSRGECQSLCKLLTGWRNDPATPWLADSPIRPTQQALKNLETGWANHFKSLKKLKQASCPVKKANQGRIF